MGDYFRGWRHKAGLVTLMMACLVTVAWIRSSGKVEILLLQSAWPSHAILSGCGRFRVLRLGNHSIEFTGGQPARTVVFRFQDWLPVFTQGWPTIERFEGDFVEVYDQSTGKPVSMPLIPYWSVVLPTLPLSAWLLLSKRRQITEANLTTENVA